MTLHLPDSLAERAEAYAAAHGTTMDAILVSHLEAVVRMEARDREGATLRAYSQGRLSRAEAIRDLGLRDYASLLVLLGVSDLPQPLQDPREVERQVAEFERLWKTL